MVPGAASEEGSWCNPTSMMMAREYLEALVAPLPKTTFHGNQGPFLTRYTLREDPDGGRLYIHHFHRSDEDEELHSHPWSGDSLILLGSYCEERRGPNHTIFQDFHPGMVNRLTPDTFHRVVLTTKDCWTLFRTGQKVQDWSFWSKKTGVTTPWRKFITNKGLPLSEG